MVIATREWQENGILLLPLGSYFRLWLNLGLNLGLSFSTSTPSRELHGDYWVYVDAVDRLVNFYSL